jgi:hypothetical protein
MANETVNPAGNDAELTTEEADAVFEQVLNCEPALLPADVDKVGAGVFDKEHVIIPWRMTALLAGEGGAFFKGISEDAKKAQVFAEAVGDLQGFAVFLREMADLADCVATRVMVAACAHEDFPKWCAASEARNAQGLH